MTDLRFLVLICTVSPAIAASAILLRMWWGG